MKIAILIIVGIVLLMTLGGGIFLIVDVIYYRNKAKEDALKKQEGKAVNEEDIA